MKQELYEEILDLLFDRVGYKCQPSEVEELSQEILRLVREWLAEEIG